MPRSYGPDIHRRGAWYRWCSGCKEWHLRTLFLYDHKRSIWLRKCRPCRTRADKRRPHLEVRGLVALTKMRPHLDYMIGVVGFRKTADRLGVSTGSLSRWAANGKTPEGKLLLRMQAKSAARILRAVQQLRFDIAAGRVVPKKRHHASGHCSGCGSDLETYTPECPQCWERRRGRERRAA